MPRKPKTETKPEAVEEIKKEPAPTSKPKPKPRPKLPSSTPPKAKVLKEPATTSLLFPTEKEESNDDMSEKYKEQLVKEVFSKQDPELKSDLNDAEIIALTKAEIFAEYYQSDLIAKLKNSFLLLKVSRKRQGRGEFVRIAESLIAPAPEEKPTIPERLFGKG